MHGRQAFRVVLSWLVCFSFFSFALGFGLLALDIELRYRFAHLLFTDPTACTKMAFLCGGLCLCCTLGFFILERGKNLVLSVKKPRVEVRQEALQKIVERSLRLQCLGCEDVIECTLTPTNRIVISLGPEFGKWSLEELTECLQKTLMDGLGCTDPFQVVLAEK